MANKTKIVCLKKFKLIVIIIGIETISENLLHKLDMPKEGGVLLIQVGIEAGKSIKTDTEDDTEPPQAVATKQFDKKFFSNEFRITKESKGTARHSPNCRTTR